MRCMVACGGHAPIANRWEFEFEKGSQISNSSIIQVGTRIQTKSQILKRGGKFEFKFRRELAHVGKRHQGWEEDTKVYKRNLSLTLMGLESVPNFCNKQTLVCREVQGHLTFLCNTSWELFSYKN